MKNNFKLTFVLVFTIILFSRCTKTPEACVSTDPSTNHHMGDTIYQGDTIHFMNCSSGGSAYMWDFGDGSTSTEINPTHIYEELGIITIKLTVTSDNGRKSSSIINQIMVDIRPPKQITITKVILTHFTDTLFRPDIFMVLSVDSNIILNKNQIHYDCKSWLEYTFTEGYPLVFNNVNGAFGQAIFEFRYIKGTNENPLLFSRSFDLGLGITNLIYTNTNYRDFYTSDHEGFRVYYEFQF